jgi:Fe2+ or Zn2+ uptake regulation protein
VITVIAPTGHVHDVIAHEPTDAELADITAGLAAQGVHIAPVVDVYRVLHLWPEGELPTVLANRAVRAFLAVTDCRVEYHDPRPPIAPSCLLCKAEGVELTHDLCPSCGQAFRLTPTTEKTA